MSRATKAAAKSKATGQKGRVARMKEGADQAEQFIEEQVAKAKRRSRKEGWPCTAEDIKRERDERGLSWKQVAINLDLGSPGQARKAYTELTGTHHSESQALVKRAPRGSGSTTRKTETPIWDDDTDQDEILDKVQGPWIEPIGEPGSKNYVPGHYRGSNVTIKRKMPWGTDAYYEENVRVVRVDRFAFDGPDEDGALVMHVLTTEAFRCFRVNEIVAVW